MTVPEGRDKEGYAFYREHVKLYEFKAGSRYFYPLCVHHLGTESIKPIARQTPYLFSHPYTRKDSSVFVLPVNFVLESIPPDKELQTGQGEYRRTCRYDTAAHQLVILSELLLKKHTTPAAEYLKMASFFRAVIALEDKSFVLTEGSE